MEVFASFQGEGLFAGEPQVFVRLFGCPLRCAWCDTPGSWRVAPEAGARIAGLKPRRESSRATPFQVACWIAEVERGARRTISLTGGEPLMWPGFVRALAGMIGERRLHLETAGAHPESLRRVLDCVDHVSLDLKLPADMGEVQELDGAGFERSPRSAEEWREARRACLALVAGRDACAKLVVSGGLPGGVARGAEHVEDYVELLEDHARLAPRVPLFLQPATPVGGVPAAPLELIRALAEEALDLGLAVRVLPQMHRVLGIP